MEKFIAYTRNDDNSINILAGSDRAEVFEKILPAGTEYEIHEGEVYTAGGKTWLTNTEQGYIDAKAKDEHDKSLAELDAQYDADKATLVRYYGEAALKGDTDLQETLKAELVTLDSEYTEARKELEA